MLLGQRLGPSSSVPPSEAEFGTVLVCIRGHPGGPQSCLLGLACGPAGPPVSVCEAMLAFETEGLWASPTGVVLWALPTGVKLWALPTEVLLLTPSSVVVFWTLVGEPRKGLFHIHSIHGYQLSTKYLYPSMLL